MGGNLSSNIFLSFQSIFKERCIILFIEAYYVSISNNSISIDFEENDITAILQNYIDENPKRKKWEIFTNREECQFDKSSTFSKGFAAKFPRIDMRFSKFWDEEEYKYYVEAKNLKAIDSSLKRRYVTTGIDNFLSGGKYENCDGLLVGYILEGSIENCKDGINKLLLKDNRQNEIINFNKVIINNQKIYESTHSQRNIKHLFLNFNQN